jgi:nucleotide-binding universal stress UspA family protein
MNAYLVGVDGSGPSDAALKWAVTRAVSQSVPLVLVHVIEDEWGLAGSDFAREAMFAGEAVLQDAQERVRDLSATVPLSARILHGSPVWELAHTCAPDDLLVVGTHKTGFLHGRVLGSRSVSVAGTAPCSVMVVPVGESITRHGVVAGMVWAEGLDRAVSAAAREADRIDEPLTLVHASPPRPDAAEDPETVSRQRDLMRRAVDAARSVAPDVTVHTRVSSRQPAEALLDASHYATMLVLEPSRRNGPAASMIGSTTHGVLMNINSPVLIARSAAI